MLFRISNKYILCHKALTSSKSSLHTKINRVITAATNIKVISNCCRGISNSNKMTISKELVVGIDNLPNDDTKKGSLLRTNDIIKPQNDTRDYRGLELPNGLKVFLISDPGTDVSAACLAVQVGHMSDSDELPGLAHFCEHMLFLGTEKYPHENGYTAFLSQKNGNSNAVTLPLMTRYNFHVAPDNLEEALDRFAQFFIAPLFTASATDREINAVDSEHQKNLSNDTWRIKQVHRHLAKPDHPFCKFGSGNKSTLCDIPKSKNIDVRDALLQFHQKWYSSNIMNLAVLGKETLNELEDIVVEKFGGIENKNVDIPVFPREPFEQNQYATKVMIVPVKDICSLFICFTTDDLLDVYRATPSSYLSHLIGHEGNGSILSVLRELGYCNGLRAGHQENKGFGFFDIQVDLTTEGIEHVDDIVHIVFQYLHMLRKEGTKKWIFDECVNMNETRFRFKDKMQPQNLVIRAVSYMDIYPLPEIVCAPYLCNEWNSDVINKLLAELVPRNCRITLIGQKFESICTETEPYYETKYCIESIPEETLLRWENCELNPKLALPQPNPFIPTNFELVPQDPDVTKHPKIIMDTPCLRVWHKQDTEFLTPKGCIAINLSNPIAHNDPLNNILNKLLVTLLRDQLNAYLYDAELAELKLFLASVNSGLQLIIRGYSDKQMVLLETLLQRLFTFTCDKERFEIMRDEYFRMMKNYRAEQPYILSNYYLSVLLIETIWTEEELLETKDLVTYERLVRYGSEFFRRLHADCFVHGNYSKSHATNICALINKHLEQTEAMISPLLARQLLRRREYKLQPGDSYLLEKVNMYHKVSSCVQLYFQMGAKTDRNHIMASLIAQIIGEPCYDCLRTKEQLGYIVASGARILENTIGIRFVVQSAHHPTFVEDRIENFIAVFTETMENMSVETFECHKQALIAKRLEKYKSINQVFYKFLHEIMLGQYHFDRREAEVKVLCTISKEEVLDIFKKYIAPNGAERRLIVVHILSQAAAKETETAEIEKRNSMRHAKITDLTAFKSSKELYPLVAPAIDIRAKGSRSKL